MASGLRRPAHPHTAPPFALQLINKEEELLEKEKSTFPLLQAVMTNKVPYEQLWVTTYEFSTKSEEWMNGEPLPLRDGWGSGHGASPASSDAESELQVLAELCSMSWYPGLRQPQSDSPDLRVREGWHQSAGPIARVKQYAAPQRHGSGSDSARQRVGAEDGGSTAVWPQEGPARVLDTSRNFPPAPTGLMMDLMWSQGQGGRGKDEGTFCIVSSGSVGGVAVTKHHWPRLWPVLLFLGECLSQSRSFHLHLRCHSLFLK